MQDLAPSGARPDTCSSAVHNCLTARHDELEPRGYWHQGQSAQSRMCRAKRGMQQAGYRMAGAALAVPYVCEDGARRKLPNADLLSSLSCRVDSTRSAVLSRVLPARGCPQHRFRGREFLLAGKPALLRLQGSLIGFSGPSRRGCLVKARADPL